MPDKLIHEALTHSVIAAFFEVYNTLGGNLLEHLYVAALEIELRARGHRVDREVLVVVRYKGQEIGRHRIDMLVDETLVLEIKSTRVLHPIAMRQLYNYLRVAQLSIGLLLHFGSEPKFYRVVNRPAR